MVKRKFTSRQVIRHLLPSLAKLGVSRLADIGQFSDLSLRVVQVVRTNLLPGQISATTGKGWNLESALCGALCEAAERYCAAYIAPRLIVRGLETTDPASSVVAEPIPARSMLGEQVRYFPAREVCFPYSGGVAGAGNFKPNTSGLACGGTQAEATLFGIFEVLERNASSFFFKNFHLKNVGSNVQLDDLPSGKARSATEELIEKGYEVLVFKIKGPLPVHYVALLDTRYLAPKFMVSGVCCAASDYLAFEGALLEAMQGLVVSLQGAREDLAKHKILYDSQTASLSNPFYKIRTVLHKNNGFSRLTWEHGKDDTDCERLCQKIGLLLASDYGHQIYICDMSDPMLAPLQVVKVIIPGMSDFFINPLREKYVTSGAR